MSFISWTPPDIITCKRPSSVPTFVKDLQTPGGIEMVSYLFSFNSSEPSSFHFIKNSPSKKVNVSKVA